MVYINNMLRTQIYLPHSQIRALKDEAEKQKTSVSEVVRQAIDENLVKKEKPKKKFKNSGEWLEYVRKHVSFKGGPKDLASNIDKYLYGEDAI